ncbi:MAG TPA: glucose 1-dehydrogenase [Candidatus Hydrogenedentes bacterium]|nr:glucose 1-dehydrogenase [Candidatus Hydrogenedentota bacterium]
MVDFSLTGKIALINGGSRGIGEAIARGFAQQGATVILSSRKQEGVDAVATSINDAGGKAVGIACHAAKSDQVDALFARIKADFGCLDVLVNNAATNPYFGPFIQASEEAYDKTFEVNCKGYFLMAQRAAQMMVEQNGGSIINIASIEGLTPSPMMGVYSMTKAAVIMLTKVITKELGGSNVRCNCICPGLTDTRFASVLINTPEIHDHYVQRAPMGRHAHPEEMVGAAIYLASEASSYTNGAIIACDGGTAA